MMRSTALCLALLALAAPVSAASSQTQAGAQAARSFAYADLADLALEAPIVAHVRVEDSDVLSSREAPNVPYGHRRFLIEASIVALIRSPGPMPAKVAWLVDIPNDARGRRARIERGTEYLVLAMPAPGSPDEWRLVAPDSLLPYSPGTADRLREILREALAPSAPAEIIGVGRAFHVPGSLPGESETQIFFLTADQRPISLSILRRPGEAPRWSVATGELVDDSAEAPERETFLWFRLACGLPRTLPPQTLAEADSAERPRIIEDYRLVLDALGPCMRHRRAQP